MLGFYGVVGGLLKVVSIVWLITTDACSASPVHPRECRTLPDDTDWPSQDEWSQLNKTLGGQLIATVPVASVCHDPTYEADVCLALKTNWLTVGAHVFAPAEILDPYFQNQTCEPFTPREQPCTLGNYPNFSINVTGPGDIQAGINFARHKNVRLTIKNTGHDLLGKSTGKGSLSLWTHNLKQIDFIDEYSGDSSYTGTAVRIGAGVQFDDILPLAAQNGVRVVSGTCGTVGAAGGYTAGGGHGSLTSLYGMAADSVLEWEVITAAGQHLVATPKAYADLYWALSGGGAGTFAVVVSMTTRTYQDGPMHGASFKINAADPVFQGKSDAFWAAVDVFHASLSPVADAGAVLTYFVSESVLWVFAVVIDGSNPGLVNQTLAPVTAALAKIGVDVNLTATAHDSYLGLYQQYYKPTADASPVGQISGGRLIPRVVIEDKSGNAAVGKALRATAEDGFNVICGAANANTRKTPIIPNAVFPLWRSMLVKCLIVRIWDYSVPWEVNLDRQAHMTNVIMPRLVAASPGGGSYLNEANFEEPDWQNVFYGSNYPRLREIKSKYDPTSLFYARTAVGSETWAENSEGRLCKV